MCFSPDGQLLVSGSDDQDIILWDWQMGTRRLRYNSGHHNNVFQARLLPYSSNRAIVTCAADGQVRVGVLREGSAEVPTTRLGHHHGRAHKLSIDPACPVSLLSSGEDGCVRLYDLRERGAGNYLAVRCLCRSILVFLPCLVLPASSPNPEPFPKRSSPREHGRPPRWPC